MFKLIVLFALVAVSFAAPQYLVGAPLAGLSPYAYSSPLSYSALSAPLSYSSLSYGSPLVKAVAPAVSYSAPAPYAYNTEPLVSYAAEPVEQHGYRIAY